METKITPREYEEYVNKKSPDSPILKIVLMLFGLVV